MIRIITIILLLLAISFEAFADGKMYGMEKVPPTIPYQRATILFKNGVETLILQSRYDIPPNSPKQPLGWIVPVPTTPEIASMPANQASGMFFWLSRDSRPKEIFMPEYFFESMLKVSFVILIISLVSFVFPIPDKQKNRRQKLIKLSIIGIFISLIVIAYFQFTSFRGSRDIEVISEQRVGIYDVRVVKATTAEDMIAWLNDNGFKYNSEDKVVFESYISKGWCFVAAKINPTKENSTTEIVSEGLAAPLILRFPQKSPIYPVALTSTGNHKTEILIYIASDMKMTSDNRLKLRFAGALSPVSKKTIFDLYSSSGVTPRNFFNKMDLSFSSLSKFKETLTPENMRQDIIFTPAKDDSEYRERPVTWKRMK